MKIEGIEAIKILALANGLAGKNTINLRDYGGGGFGFHEFVYIKMNNQWYYSDAERSCLENNNVIHSIVYLMLSPNSQDYGFTVMDSNCDKSMVKYENIYKKIKFDNLSIYDEIESKIKKNSSLDIVHVQINFIINSENIDRIISYLVQFSNLQYTTHKKDENGMAIYELVVLKIN